MTRRNDLRILLSLLCLATITGCGGSSDSAAAAGSDAASSSPSSTAWLPSRIQAATQTATQNPACTAIQPFYWEIGDQSATQASGTAGGSTPTASTPMLIASASKWLFGAYVLQHTNGELTPDALSALTMRAGYTSFRYGSCIKLIAANQNAETVHECFIAPRLLGSGANSDFSNTSAGQFYYNGGHFQWLADTTLGLGGMNNAVLASTLTSAIGTDLSLTYDSPQLAAGVRTTGQDYGKFLRKILANQLLMHDALGTQAVCANPKTCPSQTLSSPIPTTETWHYSLAHWVEDDPLVGDGAFSSPGAFGFYPWIDASKTWYGVLARYSTRSVTDDSVAMDSVTCGRKIRKAWLTATPQ
ncbi:MAG: hypothetical protein KBD60_09060 [Sterolibacterium sp.]|nr:hypothetical protein [Sterolibacterium sp.]